MNVRKIEQAIAECDKFIKNEEKRQADTRPAAVADLVEKYKAHKAKLLEMLK